MISKEEILKALTDVTDACHTMNCKYCIYHNVENCLNKFATDILYNRITIKHIVDINIFKDYKIKKTGIHSYINEDGDINIEEIDSFIYVEPAILLRTITDILNDHNLIKFSIIENTIHFETFEPLFWNRRRYNFNNYGDKKQ